ncbi:hypothetical protein PoB_000315300 [Plakobranchus ocellatus]|uniref:Uncharacterized protein n=1 Tax=Plakobranchus ocellatus TaxID=259542 RepID=A0AAV3Y2U3_9GAST|nr:hypothetical protein PoB_000315300 [Plakobranchus ocellatus]
MGRGLVFRISDREVQYKVSCCCSFDYLVAQRTFYPPIFTLNSLSGLGWMMVSKSLVNHSLEMAAGSRIITKLTNRFSYLDIIAISTLNASTCKQTNTRWPAARGGRVLWERFTHAASNTQANRNPQPGQHNYYRTVNKLNLKSRSNWLQSCDRKVNSKLSRGFSLLEKLAKSSLYRAHSHV